MISLLVINYRSAALAAGAIRSARASTTHPLHVVVVENSSDPVEADLLRGLADDVIVAPRNLGYAAGINAGRACCRGEILLVANPDIVFCPRAIDQLLEVMAGDRYAVAGPALYWDSGRQWLLPPADGRTLGEMLDEVMATRSGVWAVWRDRRRIRRRAAFWKETSVRSVRAISGAVMAIRMEDFDGAGGFDERFGLYFEETDFLRRILRMKREIAYVPEAACRHLYNQSAGAVQDQAAAAYAASEAAFLSKWYGKTAARLLKAVERPPRVPEHPLCADRLEMTRSGLMVEASPLPAFGTAAGHFPQSTSVELPEEVWESYRGRALYIRVVEPESGRVAASCVRLKS